MAEPGNVAEFTVSELSAALKRTVEDAYGYVRVRGEISGFRGQHSSGHAYFALKDDKSRLEAVIWRGTWGKLTFKPEEGLEVIATGRLTTYPGRSSYQIVIDALEPAGLGALMALLEERRRKLAAEGLFDEARKKPIPFLPRVIGVVTSPTGAVIRDILHRLDDRFPVRVLVWPVRVQGETAAAEVAAAIAGFNAIDGTGVIPRPDLLIVARGGGSLEDLWSFNEEAVVRAAAASAIPLISAVGHETDWTLIDHAADRRAPTPTGAAEIAVPVRSDLIARLGDAARRHGEATARYFEGRRREVRALERALPRPEDLLAIPRRHFDELAGRLGRALGANARAHRAAYERAALRLSPRALDRLLERGRDRLQALGQRKAGALARQVERRRALLDARSGRLRLAAVEERVATARRRLGELDGRGKRAFAVGLREMRGRLGTLRQLLANLSYESVLARGFAVIRDASQSPISSAKDVAPGAPLDIQFHDGNVAARAEGKTPSPAPRPRAPGKGGQGDLF